MEYMYSDSKFIGVCKHAKLCLFFLDVFSNTLSEKSLLLVMGVFEGPACARWPHVHASQNHVFGLLAPRTAGGVGAVVPGPVW
jgi:hypothetical protein